MNTKEKKVNVFSKPSLLFIIMQLHGLPHFVAFFARVVSGLGITLAGGYWMTDCTERRGFLIAGSTAEKEREAVSEIAYYRRFSVVG